MSWLERPDQPGKSPTTGRPGQLPRKIEVLCLGRDEIPPGSIYAGRPGPLGNPYQIGPDGDRAEVIRKFSIDFHSRLKLQPDFRAHLQKLRDINIPALYCHCPRPLPCHAEIIARYLEELP